MAFELQIRFPGSSFMVYGNPHADHETAYAAMLAHFNHEKSSSPANIELELQRVPTASTEVYQVLKTDNYKRFHPTGLSHIYRIIDRPDEKLTAEQLAAIGIVNGDASPKAYKKGAFKRKNADGDKDWSEM